jgi:thiamine-monophosphate kinase
VKLRELGEFGFIDRLSRTVTQRDGVRLGIGDDAAVTETVPGTITLTSTDMLVEGVHFDLSYSDPYSLGRKSLAVNLSDIAAMGGRPRFVLLALAIPPTLSVEFLDIFTAGFLALAEEHGVSLVGGDTCSSTSGLVISVTVMGEQEPSKVVTRAGAKPGELICVSGTVGDAAVGLELLRRGDREGWCVRRHLDPTPRLREGEQLAAAGLPSAMIDVSDGILADLGHILEHSGCGAGIELGRLPLSEAYQEAVGLLSLDPFAHALTGGEDYELLFTLAKDRWPIAQALFAAAGTRVAIIGGIRPEPGITVTGPDGLPWEPGPAGFDHFR